MKSMLSVWCPDADILEATDGRQAVELYKANTLDLIFMDVQMPVLDGYNATRQIRDIEALSRKHIPVIALTAAAFKEDEEKSIAAGMDDFLTKPISADQLKAALIKYGPK